MSNRVKERIVFVNLLIVAVVVGVLVPVALAAAPAVASSPADAFGRSEISLQDVFEWIRSFVLLVWAFDGAKVIICHTLINVVVAIAAALMSGEFQLAKLAEFLIKKLLPYTAVYVVVKIAGLTAGLDWLAPVTWAAIEATLTGDLADNLVKIGLPLPDGIKSFIVKV